MAEIVYILCAVTSLSCAVMLLRAYYTKHTRLLLWSGICFSFLALNNILLFVDLVLVPHADLFLLRSLPIVIGSSLLIFGLIWEST